MKKATNNNINNQMNVNITSHNKLDSNLKVSASFESINTKVEVPSSKGSNNFRSFKSDNNNNNNNNNNDNDDNEIQFAFSSSDSKAPQFRSVNVISNNLSNSPFAVSPNKNYIGSKMPPSKLEETSFVSYKDTEINTLPELGSLMNKDLELSEDIFVPSKVGNPGKGPFAVPETCNNYTSFLVNDGPLNVLKTIDFELGKLSDIVYGMNGDSCVIDGVVFVMNVAVNFIINVWSSANNSSCVEFRRKSGDVFAYNQFWDDASANIKKAYKIQVNKPLLPFGACLDFSFPDLETDEEKEDIGIEYSENELTSFADEISKDYYSLETLNQIISDLSKDSKMGIKILKHTKLMGQILNMLSHKDIACVRSSLIVIQELMNVKDQKEVLTQTVPIIVKLLNHKCSLIRYYAVKTLSILSNADSQWKLQKDAMTAAKKALNSVQKQWKVSKSNKFLNGEMFESINAKLM